MKGGRLLGNWRGRSVWLLVLFAACAPKLHQSWLSMSHVRVAPAGPSIVILIPVHADDFAQRTLHRSTWMKFQPKFMKSYFMTGHTNDAVVHAEAENLQDLRILNAHDDYHGLWNKTVEMMRWASTSFPTLEFVVKMDTDTMPHPFNLAAYVMPLAASRGVYLGLDCPLHACPSTTNWGRTHRFMQGDVAPPFDLD